MIMGIRWILLFVCIAYSVTLVKSEFSEEQQDAPDRNSASNFLGSIFGFKPCIDETCAGYDEISASRVGLAFENPSNDSDFEVQEHTGNSDIEKPKFHCIKLRPSIIEAFRSIESQHYGFSIVKYRILEELISYASVWMHHIHFSERCSVEMKLIDLFIYAANELKKEYRYLPGGDCVYVIGNKPEKPVENDKIDAHKPEGTPAAITMSPEYVPTTIARKGSYPPSTMKPHVISTQAPHLTEKPEAPCSEGSTTEKPEAPCSEGSTTEKPEAPCSEDSTTEESSDEEIIAEEDQLAPIVGSMRGIPGIQYPNYSDVPITSFSCADKKYIPGFYADLETGCQVFHVCYEHRRESFLCPIGTIFNQPILACDYWYSSNCSLAQEYYEVNAKHDEVTNEEEIDQSVEDLISIIVEGEDVTASIPEDNVFEDIAKFLPVKAKVTEFRGAPEVTLPEMPVIQDVAQKITDGLIINAGGVVVKARDAVAKIPEPAQAVPIFKPKEPMFEVKSTVFKVKPTLAKTVTSIGKMKLKAVIPSKIAAVKTTVPIFAKGKFAGAVSAVAAKAKVAAAVPVATKVAAAKIVAPVAAKVKFAGAVSAVTAKAKVAAAVPVAAKVAAAKIAVPVAAKVKFAGAVSAAAAKAKVAAAVPVAAKVAAAKIAVPVAAKVKFAGAVSAVAAKAKVAAALPVAAKVTAAKVALPVAAKVKLAAVAPKLLAKAAFPALKGKMVASAIPLAKTKLAAPALAGKAVKVAGIPLVKAKMFAVPLAKSKLAALPIVKAKLAKAAVISPLTKKALALGYMKLLKAKKLALMG